jgi:hypothetical protein
MNLYTNRKDTNETLRNVMSSTEVPLTTSAGAAPAMIALTGLKMSPAQAIIGQDRALRALSLGLNIQQNSYNIFGGLLWAAAPRSGAFWGVEGRRKLTDKCYVHNFRDPDSPIMITLPAGKGMAFKKDMAGFLTELMKAIPAVFESRRYAEQRKDTLEHFQQRQRTVLREFEKRVRERGFEVVQVQAGNHLRPEIAPVFEAIPPAWNSSMPCGLGEPPPMT